NAQPFHQALDGTACCRNIFSIQLLPYLACAVDAMVVIPYAPDIISQFLILFRPIAAALRMCFQFLAAVIGRRCNRQDLTDWLDTVCLTICIDKIHHYFGLRSSSAWAK